MDWYRRGHRRLPWRADRDPYRILVSETMLVQTTVAAVVPFFERFLARFPTVVALAEADESEVVKVWEGLGYYRRARQLHAAARTIVDRHGGRVPDDPGALQALPGVGRYIAGAVLSLAFDQPAPIVEANTQRVLARLLGWGEDLKTSASRRRLWKAAQALVPLREAGTFNQAIMELGATICVPREPLCLLCPISAECRARSEGRQHALPVVSARPKPLEVEERCALVRRGDRWLMVRRGPGRLWEGFWEFPTVYVSGADPAGRSFGKPVELAEGVRRLTSVRIRLSSETTTVRFGVTKHKVTLVAQVAEGLDEATSPGPGLVEACWVATDRLDELTASSAVRKLMAWVREPSSRRGRRSNQ
jgi:A/G-specific adenine glycosylase